MLTYQTAGESHGPCLIATITGLPYGLPVDPDFINRELTRRQGGYGRSHRMQVEQDSAEILTGVRGGRTIGSPVTLRVSNRISNAEELPPIHRPRPGHADFAGALKFDETDARNVSERASARETAARVAAGALASSLLSRFEIQVLGYVVELGGVHSEVEITDPSEVLARRNDSQFYVLDPQVDERMRHRVDEARAAGDTLGGVIEVRAFGVPAGLGSHATWTEKLDGRLARALMSIQSVKAVEIGLGMESARRRGSEVHDEILPGTPQPQRSRNNAGGIEGGISNGQEIIVRASCKPLSTLRQPLRTVDLSTGEPAQAIVERSDVCAVPAASVIAEAVVAFEIAAAFLDRFGGDTFEETTRRFFASARTPEIGTRS